MRTSRARFMSKGGFCGQQLCPVTGPFTRHEGCAMSGISNQGHASLRPLLYANLTHHIKVEIGGGLHFLKERGNLPSCACICLSNQLFLLLWIRAIIGELGRLFENEGYFHMLAVSQTAYCRLFSRNAVEPQR